MAPLKASETVAPSAPVTYDRPVPTDLDSRMDSPSVPRAQLAATPEHPQGSADFKDPKGQSVLQQHVEFFDRYINHHVEVEQCGVLASHVLVLGSNLRTTYRTKVLSQQACSLLEEQQEETIIRQGVNTCQVSILVAMSMLSQSQVLGSIRRKGSGARAETNGCQLLGGIKAFEISVVGFLSSRLFRLLESFRKKLFLAGW